MRIHIIRFELWGNAKDGFDVNDAHTIGREEVPGNDYETAIPALRRTARDYFAGRYLARTENLSQPMTRRKIDIEWLDDDAAQVVYAGQAIGEIRLLA